MARMVTDEEVARWREVIRLREAEAMTFPEIGEALGVSKRRAKQIYDWAKERERDWPAEVRASVQRIRIVPHPNWMEPAFGEIVRRAYRRDGKPVPGEVS